MIIANFSEFPIVFVISAIIRLVKRCLLSATKFSNACILVTIGTSIDNENSHKADSILVFRVVQKVFGSYYYKLRDWILMDPLSPAMQLQDNGEVLKWSHFPAFYLPQSPKATIQIPQFRTKRLIFLQKRRSIIRTLYPV